MSGGWTAKRFWTSAVAVAMDQGFTVQLDGRAVRTPAKAPLIVPTRAMADVIAAEWDAQDGTVSPATMPATRAANSAIDKVMPQHAEVAALIAEYGGSDLLCYRATGPAALEARQAAAWDPLLDWAADRYGAPLVTARGVMHVPQSRDSLERLRAEVVAQGPFELAALHDLVSLSGSLVIGLAAIAAESEPEALWATSRIDEDWQAEQWGVDDAAAENAARRRAAFLEAHRFFRLCRQTN